ncbi:MAG: cell division protein FtsZ [Bacteroidetes bacterium HGW-Bacteroidetes-1]|nr:MAG: cell division protein FtsZ [Bacteroidetes bacterium HGW-Bacteroidetes-1]
MLKFEHPKEQSNIIKVIGVGGGGSNAVTHMYHQGIKGVDFVLCNTDAQALEISPVPNKIHLGKRQLGAGNVPSVGRDAAIETEEEIRELLEPHTKMLFITAGMGGGTGTGAAPVVARIASELDILTVGIVTLPFSFEGKKRRQQAIEGIEELKKYVDTLLIISNDKLREEYGNMRLTEAFKKADDVLTTASKGIAEIITVTGHINVDFEDVKTVMKNSGKAIMGSAIAEGENRALKAIEEAMRSPLLNDSSISGGRNILLYITSGEEEISLDEVHEITDYIQQICGNSAEVIWGNGVDASLNNNIAITIIATGYDTDDLITMNSGVSNIKVNPLYDKVSSTSAPVNQTSEQEKPVRMHTLSNAIENDHSMQNEPSIPSETFPKPSDTGKMKIHRLFEEEVSNSEKSNETVEENITSSIAQDVSMEADDIFFEVTNPQPSVINKSEIEHQYSSFRQSESENERIEMEKKSIERQTRLKAMSMKLKTDEGIKELENQPAYQRKGTELKNGSESSDISRYSINGDQGKPGLRSDNSFLHDNVD